MRTLVRVILYTLCVHIVFQWLVCPTTIDGGSMLPTYSSGTVVWVNLRAYRHKSPARGDVVILRLNGEKYVKRVIGLPHDVLSVINGNLFINETPLGGDGPRFAHDLKHTLKHNQYFCIGDNRSRSMSAIVFRDEVIGKVLF